MVVWNKDLKSLSCIVMPIIKLLLLFIFSLSLSQVSRAGNSGNTESNPSRIVWAGQTGDPIKVEPFFADQSSHGQVQFVSASIDSFHVIFGYDNMLDYHLVPVSSGEVVPLDRPYTRAVIIARGFRDKEVAIPRGPDRQAVVPFTLEETSPEKVAETRYPMIHWDANLFLVAEPGTRFELDKAPLQSGDESTKQRMEYWNDNTLLLRLWPGTYGVTAHYPDGTAWSEEIRVEFDRLSYQPMYQNPLRSDVQRARWIPGGGQNLKREHFKATAIQAIMVTGLAGSAVSWTGYYIERSRFHYSYDTYRSAPAFSDFDDLYGEVRKHRRRTNTFSALRYAFGAILAGTYIYNVVDGGRTPDSGFREYQGINPFLDMDRYTGAPTVGIRYSRN